MVLSEYQQIIKNFYKGRCGVLASSGAGKTASIVERTAQLIEIGVKPENILIISFSKKIVEEMQERLNKRLGLEVGLKVDVKTFHALGYRMLLVNGYKCDLIKTYEIENFFKEKYQTKFNICEVMSLISYQKNHGIKPEDKLILRETQLTEKMVRGFYKEYEDFKTKLKKIDYDDMLVKAVDLLQTIPKVKEYYNNQYEFVMVDEYQDTNTIQDRMLDLITEKHGNLMCLFDYKQAIYAFRGSSSAYALEFKGDIIHLPVNYRSSQNIVRMSNEFIKDYYSSYEHHKDAISNKSTDGSIRINDFNYIDEIKRLLKEGVKPNQIAILYRNNFLSVDFENALRTNHIPYTVKNSFSFYDRFEIKTLINYLRLIANKYDNDAFVEIVNVPSRFLGREFLNKLAGSQSYFLEMDKLNGEWRYTKGIQDLKNVILRLNHEASCGQVLKRLIVSLDFKNFIKQKYYDTEDGYDDRITNIDKLIELCDGFDSIKKFLSFIDDTDKNDKECVQLMTIHKSKGLEFENVFLLGVKEDILPSVRCSNEIEEANLFYVGITRAKENLFIEGDSCYIKKLKELGY